MSRERVVNALMSLGLSKTESEVFIYLAKKGPKKEKDLRDAFDFRGQHLHQILESLRRRGIVNVAAEQYALFSALTFEEVLEMLIIENIEQAQAAQKTRKELLASWKNMIREKT